jgi:hypothetical protein
VPPPTDIERGLLTLEAELKKLEAEYNMFFSGRLPKPPWETRSRVEAMVKKLDHTYIRNYGDKFRFSTLQGRYFTFIDLWDRGMRAREEGRPGPEDRILHVAAFHDPLREIDKLTDLYESLSEARREVGEEQVPFHKFAELVKNQVKKLRETGSPEVAFRVAVKDGKVKLTARALKGVSE